MTRVWEEPAHWDQSPRGGGINPPPITPLEWHNEMTVLPRGLPF